MPPFSRRLSPGCAQKRTSCYRVFLDHLFPSGQRENISHLTKRKSSTQKCRLGGDILVPRRVAVRSLDEATEKSATLEVKCTKSWQAAVW